MATTRGMYGTPFRRHSDTVDEMAHRPYKRTPTRPGTSGADRLREAQAVDVERGITVGVEVTDLAGSACAGKGTRAADDRNGPLALGRHSVDPDRSARKLHRSSDP